MFKKILSIAVLTMLVASGASFVAHAKGHDKGGFTGPSVKGGGFTGPGPQVVSIMEAEKQADDAWITLKGYIVQRDGDDKYTFKDASGTGRVEIEDKAWSGQHVGPDDMVELITKVDKDWGQTELEVKQVRKIK